MFKYEREGRFCIVVAKVQSLDGKILGKSCLVFDYMRKQIFTIDGSKK